MPDDFSSSSIPPKDNWSVKDIWIGAIDSRGQKITYIYSKVARKFAIYRAGGRVWIQYADEDQKTADGADLGEEQRKALAPLRVIRGQIEGFVRKLEEALRPIDGDDSAEIDFYGNRVADALFNALQGNATAADEELRLVRSELLDRLRSLARVQFAQATLVATILTLLALTLFVFLVARIEYSVRELYGVMDADGKPLTLTATDTLTFMRQNHIWAAGLFGSLGAWFSIALWLRKSDLQMSTNRLDNLVDPALRIMIAIISAGVLFTMVQLGMFSIMIGEQAINWGPDKGDNGWRHIHVAIILAFIAGFSERLVGNLLDSEVGKVSPTTTGAIGANAGATSETSPLGRDIRAQRRGQSGDPNPASAPDGPVQPDEELPDTPLSQSVLDAERTPDTELPASSGGVATSDSNRWGPQ